MKVFKVFKASQIGLVNTDVMAGMELKTRSSPNVISDAILNVLSNKT